MVSWRPENEAKLQPEIFQEIERKFAAALLLTDHHAKPRFTRTTAIL
jgi:hypothetical protein